VSRRSYEVTAQARLDLLRIWHHIARDSIDAADKVKTELQLAMRKLAEMPGLGHQRRDVTNPRLRIWKVYSSLIAYTTDTAPIRVIRVVHGDQDFRKLFK
jgi:antitoxin ParD1/3/4/toxin ParE1/3/4